MAEERSLYDEFVDYAIYAPVGLVLSVVEDLPGLVAKGRARLSPRLGIANVVGRLAFGSLKHRVESLLSDNEDVTTAARPTVEVQQTRGAGEGPDAAQSATLAIAGYDSLAASQVVARLEALTASELAAIRRYENATRRRQTILSRLDQLERGGQHAD